MNLKNKLSVKEVVGNVKSFLKGMNEADVKDLVKVVGICNGSEVINTSFGDSIALKGQFKFTNLMTNQEFVSGKCYLPEMASNLVTGQLTENVRQVEFAFVIGIVAKESVQIGYEYTVRPLIEPGANDPLLALEQKIG
jgi:hypothetical protein